jgi:hypothetical protein
MLYRYRQLWLFWVVMVTLAYAAWFCGWKWGL